MTARWPRCTPSKLPMATTLPFGMSAAGVESRITVKAGGIFRLTSACSGSGPDRGSAGAVKSSGGRGGASQSRGQGRLTGCLRPDVSPRGGLRKGFGLGPNLFFVVVVRVGHGANCSSIGSVIDTLFLTALAGGAIYAAVMAALAEEPVKTAGPQSPLGDAEAKETAP